MFVCKVFGLPFCMSSALAAFVQLVQGVVDGDRSTEELLGKASHELLCLAREGDVEGRSAVRDLRDDVATSRPASRPPPGRPPMLLRRFIAITLPRGAAGRSALSLKDRTYDV
jgi:hypothetical protein